MALKCGIVGLPNVGKSTLFNALTASLAAEAANYPFCTIEPNTGTALVPDERLEKLAALVGSAKIIPAYMEFVDIAGLVKGAGKGEGLGNKFLAHIREVDAIIHVLRCFEEPDITHVHGRVDPIYDAEVIETELIIADLESVEKRLATASKRFKTGDKALKDQIELLTQIFETLNQGKPVRSLYRHPESGSGFYEMLKTWQHDIPQLLTSKPVLYVCNVLEHESVQGNKLTELVAAKAASENAGMVIISSKIEAEIANLENKAEQQEFLNSLGLLETGLSKIIKASYSLLDLKSFFTVGPKEAHAWTFKEGSLAPEAAGIIHTDFTKGFIRAEVISYEDYIKFGDEAKVKEAGKMRLEGKEYKMRDGDVVHFRFNV